MKEGDKEPQNADKHEGIVPNVVENPEENSGIAPDGGGGFGAGHRRSKLNLYHEATSKKIEKDVHGFDGMLSVIAVAMANARVGDDVGVANPSRT